MVTVRDITLFKGTYGIWSLCGPILIHVGQLKTASCSQLCFHLMIRSDNAAPFLSTYDMHNAAHRVGALHSNPN